MQAEHQVIDIRHYEYGSLLCVRKSLVCKESIKRLVSLRIQSPNCFLYLGLELYFLWQIGRVVCPCMFLIQELKCACDQDKA